MTPTPTRAGAAVLNYMPVIMGCGGCRRVRGDAWGTRRRTSANIRMSGLLGDSLPISWAMSYQFAVGHQPGGLGGHLEETPSCRLWERRPNVSSASAQRPAIPSRPANYIAVAVHDAPSIAQEPLSTVTLTEVILASGGHASPSRQVPFLGSEKRILKRPSIFVSTRSSFRPRSLSGSLL